MSISFTEAFAWGPKAKTGPVAGFLAHRNTFEAGFPACLSLLWQRPGAAGSPACPTCRSQGNRAGQKTMVPVMNVEKLDERMTLFDIDGFTTSWLIRDRRNILIESGYPVTVPELLDGLRKVSMTPRDIDFIALTHVHLDHAGGAGYIARENPDLKVLVHEKGARHLIDPSKLMESVKKAYGSGHSPEGDMIPIPERQVMAVGSGDSIDLGESRLEVHPTPGHAKHHLVYFDTRSGSLFSGDALGGKLKGLPNFLMSPPSDYDKESAKQSIDAIKAMKPRRICFTHCGPFATDELDGFYDTLKKKHDLWSECIREIACENPEADPEEMFEHFIERNKELENYPELHFSFRLSVKGILIYLKKTGKVPGYVS